MHRRYLHLLFLVMVCLFLTATVSRATTQKEVQVLVLTDRIASRMEPQIFYAFRSAAKTAETSQRIEFLFTVFNPYSPCIEGRDDLKKAMFEIRETLDLVVGVVVDLRYRLKPGQTLFNAVNGYARSHPSSSISRLKQAVENLMANYGFLIVESTAETVIHPIFYNPDVKKVEVGYAKANDIKDTLYGLFFIQAALDHGKPVYGTCHGAQLGWLLAGGGLTRLFACPGEEPSGAYFSRRNPHTGQTEIWWMDGMLNTHDPLTYHDSGQIIYPLPELFAKGRKGLYINKDFNHTLAMTIPIPPQAEVLSYHPLSRNMRDDATHEITDPIPGYPMVTDVARTRFKSMLKEILIVDVFKYKTLFGFQFHPQETYDEFAASAVFEYLTVLIDKRFPNDK